MTALMLPVMMMLGAAGAGAERPLPEPRNCIEMRTIRDTRLSREQGYFVRVGRQWWRNEANQCPLFGADRSVQIVTTINRQCRGDQLLVFHNLTRIEFGTCVLSDWQAVPADSVPSGRRLRD
jgi:hypothetical protein